MKITIGNFELYPDMVPTIDRVMNNPVEIPINDLLTLTEWNAGSEDINVSDLGSVYDQLQSAQEKLECAEEILVNTLEIIVHLTRKKANKTEAQELIYNEPLEEYTGKWPLKYNDNIGPIDKLLKELNDNLQK